MLLICLLSVMMAIHQFDADLALSILKEMKRIAPAIIILDYVANNRLG